MKLYEPDEKGQEHTIYLSAYLRVLIKTRIGIVC